MLLAGYAYSLAQEPVLFNCTEVDASGGVTIWWTPPTNSTGFDKYIIYYSPNGSNFTKLDSTDVALTNNYFHPEAMAQQGSRYYFIEARFEFGITFSDTLQTIFLQLNNLNFNVAQLYWNAVSEPLPDGSSDTYNIYKEYPEGNWILTNSTTEHEYSEPVIVCNDSVNYRIEIENAKGCKSVSNTDGAWFKILDEPEKPVIDSISVNENEHIVIGWESVSNARAYIIYRFDSGIWLPVDTVIGKDNTFYEDFDYNPCLENTAWTVATIDSCGSSGPKDENEERQNIRIYSAVYDPCSESISLSWNNYHGPLADEFEIWVSENDGDFILAGINQQNNTVFEHAITGIGSGYTYFIRARLSSGTSTTCKKSVQTYFYNKPQIIYLANASVMPSNYVELSALVDTLVSSSAWQFWRSEPNGGNYSLIHTINSDDLESYPLHWVDSSANASEGYYQYYINVLDSCEKDALESNVLKTIWLSITGIDEDQNLLEWNAFEGWDGGVEKYYIYRMVNGVEPGLPFDSVDAQTFQYTDDLSSISNLNGPLVYWVQAIEQEDNIFALNEKANSNRTGVALESEMFVANAFNPLGYTKEFQPVFRFYNGRNYLFQVYNRWGKLIFETHDPYKGWDGRYNESLVQQGSYIYRLVYQNLDDTYEEKKGTVTIVY